MKESNPDYYFKGWITGPGPIELMQKVGLKNEDAALAWVKAQVIR